MKFHDTVKLFTSLHGGYTEDILARTFQCQVLKWQSSDPKKVCSVGVNAVFGGVYNKSLLLGASSVN